MVQTRPASQKAELEAEKKKWVGVVIKRRFPQPYGWFEGKVVDVWRQGNKLWYTVNYPEDNDSEDMSLENLERWIAKAPQQNRAVLDALSYKGRAVKKVFNKSLVEGVVVGVRTAGPNRVLVQLEFKNRRKPVEVSLRELHTLLTPTDSSPSAQASGRSKVKKDPSTEKSDVKADATPSAVDETDKQSDDSRDQDEQAQDESTVDLPSGPPNAPEVAASTPSVTPDNVAASAVSVN